LIAKLLSYSGTTVSFDWIKRSDGTSEFEDYLDSLPGKDAGNHSFTKKSLKTPKVEIEHAKAMRKNCQEGEENEENEQNR